MNEKNGLDVRLEAIDEAHRKIEWVKSLGIGSKMINKLIKLGNIGRYSGLLMNIEELAK